VQKITAFVSHSDCSRHDTGWNHPEHQGRLPALMRTVHRDMLTLFEPLLEVEGRHASEEELRLAHTEAWLDVVRVAVAEAAEESRSLPFGEEAVVSAASWDAATAASGSVLTGIDAVLAGEVRNAFCAVRPPGGRVGRGSGGGFGIFNNVAIGGSYLAERAGIERILLVDLGARPSTGTVEILGADPRFRFAFVFEGSEEVASSLPGVARPLQPGAPGAAFVDALSGALREATAGFDFDFVLLAVGFDALSADPLGNLALEPADYFAATEVVRDAAERACDGRLVSVLEGGYHPGATGEAVVQHLRSLASLQPL
jgi:acetoin utilization deacetylase AcuC-like enzyme